MHSLRRGRRPRRPRDDYTINSGESGTPLPFLLKLPCFKIEQHDHRMITKIVLNQCYQKNYYIMLTNDEV